MKAENKIDMYDVSGNLLKIVLVESTSEYSGKVRVTIFDTTDGVRTLGTADIDGYKLIEAANNALNN